jgi:beta-barrel assembly-enhancing protease
MRALLVAAALWSFGASAAAQGLGDFLKQLAPKLSLPGMPQTLKPQAQPQAQPAVPQPGLFSETSVEEEVAIGRRLAGNLLGAVPLVKDDRLQTYVNRVGRWVASQSERADLNWHFGVLDAADVNAFAVPGGYVFLTRGLYAGLGNEAELAGVLAHEIGHVVMKHHLKVLKQSRVVGFVSGLASSQIGQRRPQDAVIQNLLGNGAEAVARGLDKDAEFEADRVGVVLATRAGYNPYGLPFVLERLARVNRADTSVALLFKTHPPAQDRLMHLGDAMGTTFDEYSDGKSVDARFAASRAGK